jgi:hypothetical protein
MYVGFLLSEPHLISCCRLGEIMNISHDSVNRFLNREHYSPEDLFKEVKPTLNLNNGVLSVDDSVLDKPYTNYIAYVGYFWSGKHHKSVKGINLITLYYTDPQGQQQPVNFRIYDKLEHKTKNDYFLEMLSEVIDWGINPSYITGDSWYSCVKNLKTIKNHQCGFCFGLESNRLVSVEKGSWIQVQALDISENGTVVWLREFGQVKIFRTYLKDQVRHYGVYLPNEDNANDIDKWEKFTKIEFNCLHDKHWQIEQYHRVIKQVCNIEHFQVRNKAAVKNHIFSAICGYVKLQQLRVTAVIENCYGLQRDLFKKVISAFISAFTPSMNLMNAQFIGSVNA